MSTCELRYGQRAFHFEFEAERFSVLRPAAADTPPLSPSEILVELANPYDAQPLEDIIDFGESALIVIPGAAHAAGSPTVVPLLVGRLLECGLKAKDLAIIFATGIYGPMTEGEKRQLITDRIFEGVRTLDHRADDETQMIEIGETSRRNPIWLNRALTEFTHVMLTGAIGFHPVAGFSGGPEILVPGLASSGTARRTYRLAGDEERGGQRAGAGRLDGNIVHEEIEEACVMLAPSFLINTLLNADQQITRIVCGDWRLAHRRGCAEYADEHTVSVSEQRELVIVSCGGTLRDVNLIRASEAIEYAQGALADGGTMIVLAECAGGFGDTEFLRWFEAADSRALGVSLCDDYQVHGQAAWALLNKAERYDIILVSALPPEQVQTMRMRPAPTLDEAWRLAEGRDKRGYVIPQGAETLPVRQ